MQIQGLDYVKFLRDRSRNLWCDEKPDPFASKAKGQQKSADERDPVGPSGRPPDR